MAGFKRNERSSQNGWLVFEGAGPDPSLLLLRLHLDHVPTQAVRGLRLRGVVLVDQHVEL